MQINAANRTITFSHTDDFTSSYVVDLNQVGTDGVIQFQSAQGMPVASLQTHLAKIRKMKLEKAESELAVLMGLRMSNFVDDQSMGAIIRDLKIEF